ncbi:MAG: GAF domain-containing protein [Crocinitomicaceae bacterium]
MSKHIFLILLFVVFETFNVSSLDSIQTKLSDLDTKLISENNTAAKVDILIEKSNVLLNTDYKAAEKSLLEAQLLANDIDYNEGLLLINSSLANIYTYYAADYFKAMQLSSSALLIAKDINDQKSEMSMHKNISFIFSSLKDTKKAISYAENAYLIALELNDKKELANLNTLLGNYYEILKDTSKMINHYGSVLQYKDEPFFSKSPKNYLSIGKFYLLKNETNKAESYFNISVNKCQALGDNQALSIALEQSALFYLEINKSNKALSSITLALRLSDSLDYTKERVSHFKVLSAVYQRQGKYKLANEAINKYYNLKDSLYNEKISNQIFLFEDDFKSLLKENELQMFKDKELANDLKLKNEQLKRNLLVIGLLFLLLSALALYNRLRVTKRLNNQLVDQKNELELLSIVASDINNAVIIFDENNKIEWVNKGYTAISNYTIEDVKGRNPFRMEKGPKWNQEKADYAWQMMLAKKAFNMEYLDYNKDGDLYWLDVNVTPSFNENNELMKYILVGSVITEKKEADIELQNSYESARLLSEIGVGITAAKTVDDIVDLVYGKIIDLMDAPCFGVGLLDKEKQSLNFVSFIEKGQKYREVSCSLEEKNKMGVIAMLESKTFFINDFEKHSHEYIDGEVDVVAGDLPKSLIYIPLWSKGQAIGVLTVQSFEKNAYTKGHYNLAKNIANYMAIAIEKTLLYQGMESEVEKRTKEIVHQKDQLLQTYSNTKLLSEIGLDISSSLRLDKIFETVHSKISRLMDAEMFGIRIYHEDLQQIEYNYEIESGELDPLGFLSMEDKNNYTVWCIENKNDVFIRDNEIEYVNYIETFNVLTGKVPRSLIFTPMIIDDKVIGVLTVQSMRVNAFERHHLDLLKSLGAFVASALVNGTLYSTLETKVNERTKDLAEKNKNITDSINYAKRIQNGILPSDKLIHTLLPKSFVYFKPKDIVSGDFYWMAEKNGKVFVAVVDCTGHGVPGAFMSIIGESLLEQAINEPYITHTNQILDFIQEGIQKLFEQESQANGYNEISDGMDMSLLAINMHKKRIEYSGASNSLFKVRDNEVERIRGDKYGISAVDYGFRRPFSSQYVDFEAGDAFYIFTDGVPDQFGGPRTKKYGYKNTSSLLSKISTMAVENQRSEVKSALDEWTSTVEQTDDICLFGFKI